MVDEALLLKSWVIGLFISKRSYPEKEFQSKQSNNSLTPIIKYFYYITWLAGN